MESDCKQKYRFFNLRVHAGVLIFILLKKLIKCIKTKFAKQVNFGLFRLFEYRLICMLLLAPRDGRCFLLEYNVFLRLECCCLAPHVMEDVAFSLVSDFLTFAVVKGKHVNRMQQ